MNVSVAEDANYNASAVLSITVTISDKQTQTITAADVIATYGDTGKSVSATTDGDGTLSYAVKSGDAVTVDENTGTLTILKAGTAVITVTASETGTYTQAVKDVTVTIHAVAPTVTTAPKAETLSYTGQAQKLVSEGEAEGGAMQYALGTDAETAPTSGYSAEIPTETEAGTYYVWYKVVGDENHADSEPVCVTVVIVEKIEFTVTFKVVNGSWDDGSRDEKTVVLSGTAGEELKLTAADIPSVGSKPDTGYLAGSWDEEPSTEKVLTAAVTYTYSYVQKEAAAVTKAPAANTLTYGLRTGISELG